MELSLFFRVGKRGFRYAAEVEGRDIRKWHLGGMGAS
jgi:hypothetical protein